MLFSCRSAAGIGLTVIARHLVCRAAGGRLNAEALDQPVLGREHAILRIELGEPRGLGLLLHVVARVLRIEHVEQRAAADVELLAVGQQQVVGNRGPGSPARWSEPVWFWSRLHAVRTSSSAARVCSNSRP